MASKVSYSIGNNTDLLSGIGPSLKVNDCLLVQYILSEKISGILNSHWQKNKERKKKIPTVKNEFFSSGCVVIIMNKE